MATLHDHGDAEPDALPLLDPENAEVEADAAPLLEPGSPATLAVDADADHAEIVPSTLPGIRQRLAAHGGMADVEGRAGSHHQYGIAAFGSLTLMCPDEDEKVSAAQFINTVLGGDSDCSMLLPIDVDTLEILEAVKNGVILCKLVNHAVPGTIDRRRINVRQPISIFQQNDNLNMALEGARKIGVVVVNMGANDFKGGRIHIVLGFIWQILQIDLLAAICLEKHPELVTLLDEDETLEELHELSPDIILLRWLNYHLRAAGLDRQARNMTKDLADSECLTVLLSQLAPGTCLNQLERAQLMLEESEKIDCRRFITPNKVCMGSQKLMQAFLANLFNSHHGLPALSRPDLDAVCHALNITVTDELGTTPDAIVEEEEEEGKKRKKKKKKRRGQHTSPVFHTSLFGFDGAPNPPCS